jgi:SAM-dependent methyltransferase
LGGPRGDGPLSASDDLKLSVREHWSQETCGTRGIDREDRIAFFRTLEDERYTLEPYIRRFARFDRGAGRDVLEIGVGAGTDHVQWARAGARLTGIDLTEEGIALARERLGLEGLQSELHVADAEALPFEDSSFDIVYSYGVLHHSPDTRRCLAEVRRVLRPGGQALIMVYNLHSFAAFNMWMIHCAARGRPWRSPRQAIFDHMESPGTKAYTRDEVIGLMDGFEVLSVEAALQGGDLLHMRRSARYQHPMFKLAWALYPRWLVRRFPGFGLAWLIEARRP